MTMVLYAFIDSENKAVNFVESEGAPEHVPDGCAAVAVPAGSSYGYGWVWDGSAFAVPQEAVVVPETVTPRQVRLLLLGQGLLDQVEAMIATRDRASQITWEFALEFRRDDPLLAALATDLNLSPEQVDQFFIAASQL